MGGWGLGRGGGWEGRGGGLLGSRAEVVVTSGSSATIRHPSGALSPVSRSIGDRQRHANPISRLRRLLLCLSASASASTSAFAPVSAPPSLCLRLSLRSLPVLSYYCSLSRCIPSCPRSSVLQYNTPCCTPLFSVIDIFIVVPNCLKLTHSSMA